MGIHSLLQASVVALCASSLSASAQELRPYDMAQIPLQDIQLHGGAFSARLLEETSPYKSQLLIECPDCAAPTSALVGLNADATNEGAAFAADPDGLISEIHDICIQRADPCRFSRSSIGAMQGYAYTAKFPDGIHIVEHIYYSNGLVYVINAESPSLVDAKANVAVLIKVVSPYVTGARP